MLPKVEIEMEGTPVAIAGLAVAGIVAVAYSPLQTEARVLAIGALGQLAGAAGGVAIPRSPARHRGGLAAPSLADTPARFPPDWGEGG